LAKNWHGKKRAKSGGGGGTEASRTRVTPKEK